MTLRDRYLDLLAHALTDSCHELTTAKAPSGIQFVWPTARETGDDWPTLGETMIGLARLKNLRKCLETIVHDGVSGDVIECGVWRGGACIFAAAVLETLGDHRPVYVADSFCGLPAPSDARDATLNNLHESTFLRVSLDRVKSAFSRYGLLLANLVFVEGEFSKSLPGLVGQQWSLIRCDADMYASTMSVLENLYPGLSPGGFCIIDEYHLLPQCREATDEYRERFGIAEPVIRVDNQAGFWRKRIIP